MIQKVGQPFLLAGLVLTLWSIAAAVPEMAWNSARLYPTHLIAAGISPYPTPNVGVTTGWIYGPIMPLLHLPATWASSLPWALVVSGIINQAALLVPAGGLVWVALRSSGMPRVESLLGLIGFFGLFLIVPQTRNYLFWIHCDQVAIGMAIASCWSLARVLVGRSSSTLPAAALAAAAIWSKQVAVLLPVGQLLVLAWSTRDARRVLRFALELLAAGLAFAAVFVVWFGFDALAFNLWTVPAGHGFKSASAFGEALGQFIIVAAPATVATWWAMRRLTPNQVFISGLLRTLLVCGWLQAPLQLWSATKIGASQNSVHATVLLLLAGMISLWMVFQAFAWWQKPHWRLAAVAILVAAGANQAATKLPTVLIPSKALFSDVSLARIYPGETYYPDNPLITFWAEKAVYHLEYGLVDQAAAGFPVGPENYREFTPSDLRVVLYSPQASVFICPQVYPDLQRDPTITWRPVFRRLAPAYDTPGSP